MIARERKIPFFFVTTLTLVRVPLVALFLGVNLLAQPTDGGLVLGSARSHAFWFSVAFGAMALCALSDLLDGFCARRFNIVTRLGAYADPLSDKVFYLTTLPTLVFLAALQGQPRHGLLLLALTIVFLLRDQWVSFLRSIGAFYHRGFIVNWSAQARALFSFPSVCVVYWFLLAPAGWPPRLDAWAVIALETLCLAINVVSAVAYTIHCWPWIGKELESTQQATNASPQPSEKA